MEPREYTIEQVQGIGAAVFHGHVESRDSMGRYSGEGHKGEPIKEAVTAYPYGFRSYAPRNTGLVLTRSAMGLLVLSQENALPSGVSEPESGETLLYNAHGAEVHLDENGDVNATPASGRFVLLGRSPTDFVALYTPVQDGLDDLQSEAAAHVHTVTVDAGTHTGTTSPTTSGAVSISDVAADEVKAK